jgi:cytochrome c-type biogenesis protein CcmH/NrfG
MGPAAAEPDAPQPIEPDPPGPAFPRAANREDPQRAAQWLKMGDRHFRVKDLVRATTRYEQALRYDETSAAPRVRLAQVAIARGQYREAVMRLREAQAAEPGWLAFAEDVQGLFPEPADFAAMIGRLETHLQAHPEDRDAWLILGAQWFLSGRSQQAADAFARLTDRQPDSMLAAFLDAAKVVNR